MTENATLLKVEELSVRFGMKGGGLFAPKKFLYAVDNVSFELARGKPLPSLVKVVRARRQRRWQLRVW